jgi:anaerobic selenocysteine-containing dehydrogenase
MTSTKPTFCRICEPNCALVATFDEREEIIELTPEYNHPSEGIACHKGLQYIDVHYDPDRVNWPQRRTNEKSAPAEFSRTDWASSLKDIGVRLRAIRDEFGPDSIVLFGGNPHAMDAAGLLTLPRFYEAVGMTMRFGSGTQDMTNKTAGAAYMYGSSSGFVVPDLHNTDYILCVGSNPRVSRWTFMSVPQDNLDFMKQMVKRGGKVRFVNPRVTESSTPDTGPTLLIKPGTDVYFLAAVLHEIGRLNGFDRHMIETWGKNFEELIDFVSSYPPERVEPVTGISAADIKQVASEIIAAPSAVVYIATGVNQSRQGLLAYWVAEMINFATGNFGRRGGMFKPAGLTDHCEPVVGKVFVETSLGAFELPDPPGYTKLPAVLLADLVERGDVRAVISWYGNPLLTIGGEDRMRAAFEKLDLFVSVDLYRNVTAEIADYILPGTDWLERPDINLTPASGMQLKPHVMYTDAMVQPMYERRDGWWILARIMQEMGLNSPLDSDPDAEDAGFLFDSALAARGLSVDALRASPFNTVMLAENPVDSLFEQCLQHPDHLVDCCPPAFRQQGLIRRCSEIFDEMLGEPAGTLKLISLRTKYMHNSTLVNVTRYRRGRNYDNPLHMCEEDARMRGLFDGDRVRIWNENGAIESHVCIDNDLRSGVVAMSHGYGTGRAKTMRIAARNEGANCNVLMPSGVGTFEALSYMSWLSGVPVEVAGITD